MDHCLGVFSQEKVFFTTFLLAGLTAGVTHCIAMCGPFTACHAVCSAPSCHQKTSLFSRAFSIPYHLGRLVSYGSLGFVVALLSKQISSFKIWPYIAAAMLCVAGAMFLVNSFRSCKHPLIKTSLKFPFVHGVLLGFLPCGALYAALMMAAALAQPVYGMLAMMLFVLGTVPALLMASVTTHLLSQKWQHTMQRASAVVMAFNGLSLFVMATDLVR